MLRVLGVFRCLGLREVLWALRVHRVSRRVFGVHLRALLPCLDPKGKGWGFASRGDPG